MSWHFGSANLEAIIELVEDENTTVESVLDSTVLMSAIRNAHPKVIDFLFRNDDHLRRIIDIALTDVELTTPLPAKTRRTAVQILTLASSSSIMNILNKNEMFKERINQFPLSKFANDERCCGHFCGIVEAFARFNSGQNLKTLTTLRDFIINNLSNTGIRELFVTLTTDFSNQFEANSEFFVEMVSKTTPVTSYFVVSAIDQAVHIKEDVYKKLNNAEFIKKLVEIGNNEENKTIARIDAYLLASRVIHCRYGFPTESIKDFIEEESKQFDFEHVSDSIASAALSVLYTTNANVLLRIFDKKSSTTFRSGIVHSLEEMPNEDLINFVQKNDFVRKIIDGFTEMPFNYQISEIAKLLQRKKVAVDNEEFNTFITDVVDKREVLRNKEYGGDRPHLNLSSTDSYDDFGSLQPADYDINDDFLSNLSSDSSSDDSSSSSSSDSSSDDEGSPSLFVTPISNLNFLAGRSDDSEEDDDELGLPPPPENTFGNIFKLPPQPPSGDSGFLPPPLTGTGLSPPTLFGSDSELPPPPMFGKDSGLPPPPLFGNDSGLPPPPMFGSDSGLPPPPMFGSDSGLPPPPMFGKDSELPPPPPIGDDELPPPPTGDTGLPPFGNIELPPPPIFGLDNSLPPLSDSFKMPPLGSDLPPLQSVDIDSDLFKEPDEIVSENLPKNTNFALPAFPSASTPETSDKKEVEEKSNSHDEEEEEY